MRRKHEFWYRQSIVNRTTHHTTAVEKKKELFENMLARHIAPDKVGSILDFGGDSGQLIPDFPGAEKVVLDISNAKPLVGVTHVRNKEAIAGKKFDVILASGVLEHYSDPNILLEQLSTFSHEETIILVAVPWEPFSIHGVFPAVVTLYYLSLLRRFRYLFQLVDFYSTFSRYYLRILPPMGIIKISEHINYFNNKSLRWILERNGFQTLDICTIPRRTVPDLFDIIICVARKYKGSR